MRTPVNAFYYPDMISSDVTLKKAVLFFDELHFVDRASYSFGGGGQGQIMTIGCASPLRSYEASFRENGVPLYVHGAPNGPLPPETLERVAADINDSTFITLFQQGLGTSNTFRNIEITPGNYGESGMQKDLVQTLVDLSLAEGLSQHDNAMALLIDGTVEAFRTRPAVEKARVLVHSAARCSVNINVALQASSRNGMIPFADAPPFGRRTCAALPKHYSRYKVLRSQPRLVQFREIADDRKDRIRSCLAEAASDHPPDRVRERIDGTRICKTRQRRNR